MADLEGLLVTRRHLQAYCLACRCRALAGPRGCLYDLEGLRARDSDTCDSVQSALLLDHILSE